ncbi:MAG: DUF4442 domain-containing protein [Crocinitomicaceae bacterium]|nr:DUF4442 domain-containing protein [Flavobacteriales bacterium]NQZ37428.1 DUF4442 domain-containing protein [Crocinitomicaceae bacterium]
MVKFGEWVGRKIGTGRAFKFFFNISPMYRRSGGRIVEASENLEYIKIKIRLNYKTRNYVGTMYGGHMYSCLDGIYMVQLLNLLGKSYVVWDKMATIKFKRPGTSTLFAEFNVSKELIEKIKADVAAQNEIDIKLDVHLVDSNGNICAEVEKIIYISSKDFFKEKQKQKRAKNKSTIEN